VWRVTTEIAIIWNESLGEFNCSGAGRNCTSSVQLQCHSVSKSETAQVDQIMYSGIGIGGHIYTTEITNLN
jgi:hypothetical protein